MKKAKPIKDRITKAAEEAVAQHFLVLKPIF